VSDPKIKAEEVESVFMDSLFLDNEIIEGVIPAGAVIVEGILNKFALHPGRLESHRLRVSEFLKALPDPFQAAKGGGWSFLNACDDSSGIQWTGLHQTMDHLFCLGMALNLCKLVFPHDMWEMLPGSMPYYQVLP
jgi:hypothetical protein